MILGFLAGDDSSGRIKVGRGTIDVQLSVFRRLNFHGLAENRASCHAILVIMALASVHSVPTMNVFRVGDMRTMISLRVFQPPHHLQWVSCACWQVPYFRSRRFIMFVCLVRFCGFFRGLFFCFF